MNARDHLILIDLYFLGGVFLLLWLVLRLRRFALQRRERRQWQQRLKRLNEQSHRAARLQ